MQTLTLKERNFTIDIAKFICLFLMVYCHIPISAGYFHESIYSFHMPLFFFVGGLFFSHTNFSLEKGFQTLILPYICFNILILVFNTCVEFTCQTFSIEMLIGSIKGIIFGNCRKNPYGINLPSGASWFLVAYFFTKMAMKYVIKQVNIINTISVIALAICIIFLRNRWTICLWNLDSAVLGLVFFYTAYAFKRQILVMLNSRKSFWLLFLLFPLTSVSWINGQVDMFSCVWGGNPLLFFLFAFVGIMCVLLLGEMINSYKFYLPTEYLSNILSGSIFIICMNLWLIDYISLIYRRVFHIDTPFLWYEKVSITLLIFIIALPSVDILMKYFPFMLGKKNNKR